MRRMLGHDNELRSRCTLTVQQKASPRLPKRPRFGAADGRRHIADLLTTANHRLLKGPSFHCGIEFQLSSGRRRSNITHLDLLGRGGVCGRFNMSAKQMYPKSDLSCSRTWEGTYDARQL
jgi:hypothetical protein